MEIKAKVFKRKSGKSSGKWIARVEYFDAVEGRAKTMERQAAKRTDAIDERDRLVIEIRKSHGQIQTGERMTFDHLADVCEGIFYKPAVLVDGRKIDGVRSIVSVKAQINNLRAFFGKRLITEITTESLTSYKVQRMKPKGADVRPVKVATVNRELSAMRKMMRFAVHKGWILRDIFFNAGVIDVSAEMERTRRLSEAEETLLLEACQGEREMVYERNRRGKVETITAKTTVDNPHLKAIILLAVDSGMRRGEILKLRWQDIDFGAGVIRILGTHTKTERERLAPLTDRVKSELYRVREFCQGDKPFPFTEFKRSWTTAKRIAGIGDLHFHDLRRTAVTRWIMQGNPIAMAGKIAGHANIETTMRHYTSTDTEIVQSFAKTMNAVHAQNDQNLSSEMVN